MENNEVSPYIFDASQTKPGEWPGKWEQTGRRFTWVFPDQSIRIDGTLNGLGKPVRLTGTATASDDKFGVSCAELSKLPKIGDGLVIPRDSRFIDLDGDEGELKVPAGISLQERGSR